MEIKTHYFVSIPAFAVTELDLTSTELIVYSTIYGFSHGNENQWCCVSQSYLATWARTTERSVRRIIDRLIEKGLIIKEVRNGENGTYCAYKVFERSVSGEDTESTGGEDTETTPPGHSVRPYPDTASAPTSNNIYNNINNNKENIIKENSESEKDSVPESSARKKGSKEKFIKPTVEEIRAYCRERNNIVDAERFYDYYESNGWKVGKNTMKDWKAAVRTWERNGFDTGKRGSDPFDIRNQYWDESDPTVH
jgi:hypothetical protein